MRRIALEASYEPRLGARALKEVFRRVMRDYEFDPASHVNGPAKGGPENAVMLDVGDVEQALEKRQRG